MLIIVWDCFIVYIFWVDYCKLLMVIPQFYISTSSSSTSTPQGKIPVVSISSDSSNGVNQPNRPRSNPETNTSFQNTSNTANPKSLKVVRSFLHLDDKPYNPSTSEPESSSCSNSTKEVAPKPFPPPGFKIKHMARKQPKDTVDLHPAKQIESDLDLFTTRYGGLPEGYSVRLPDEGSLANQTLGPNE